MGIAILGSIGTAVYRSQVADAVPADVPPDAAEAARDTLGGAVAAADELPDQPGTQVLDAARESFTQGLQLSSIMSVALVLGMAILVLVLLRHIRAGGETAETAEADAATVAVEERS